MGEKILDPDPKKINPDPKHCKKETHLLEGQRPLDDVLAHVVVLGQVEQLPDLGGPLGAQPENKGTLIFKYQYP